MKIRQPGFTLAEVLIALALLGVIAALAIPKLMTRVDEHQKRLVLRETWGALSAVYPEGYLKNELTYANSFNYVASKLNAIKTCAQATTGGCYTSFCAYEPGGQHDNQLLPPV